MNRGRNREPDEEGTVRDSNPPLAKIVRAHLPMLTVHSQGLNYGVKPQRKAPGREARFKRAKEVSLDPLLWGCVYQSIVRRLKNSATLGSVSLWRENPPLGYGGS